VPTLTQLEYVLAVQKERHFGKAAKACNVSQPTLSQQIQKLEDELGIILFDRIQKPIIPTDAGLQFLAQAKVVIRENTRLLDLVRKGSGGVCGEFRIGIIPSVSSDLVPLFISRFSKEYPNVELHIEELKTESILNELKNDRLDAGILATPLPNPGFKVHPLYYEPFVLYLSRNHPLLRKKNLKASDLDGSEMWMLADGHCFRNQVVNFCSFPRRQDTVLANVHFESGSLDTLRNLVRKGTGYTMLPLLMNRRMSDAEVRQHVRTFKSPVPTRDHWKLDIIAAIESAIGASTPSELGKRASPDQLILEIC
jgi:LysR family hydrogen peroxide-inducible transcriptional activator